MNRRRLLPLSLWALILAVPVSAADEESKLPVSIFCPAYADGLKSVLLKSGDDIYRNVALSTANVVDGGEGRAENGRIQLYGPATGDGAHPVVASVDVTGVRQPLIVLVPEKEGGGTVYQAKAVESGPETFPMGSFKLLNLSPHPVRVTFGEVVTPIEPGAETLLKPGVPPGEAVAVTIEHKSGDEWQLLSSARWASRTDRRTLVCIQWDAGSKRMALKSVPLREISGK